MIAYLEPCPASPTGEHDWSVAEFRTCPCGARVPASAGIRLLTRPTRTVWQRARARLAFWMSDSGVAMTAGDDAR